MALNERGLSLVELSVVFVLAMLVMVGLVSFYLSSQATWVNGSAEAQTQREATLLTEIMADSIHAASQAIVDPSDPQHQNVTLYRGTPPTAFYMFWRGPDSLVYRGTAIGASDQVSVVSSTVTRFELQSIGDTLVVLTMLELRSASGDLVHTSTSFATYNR
jgi:Tfp pilus assembly protein PilW